MFVSWSAVVERCPRCSHRFESHEGYWLGAIAINTVATIFVFILVFVGSIVSSWPDPPWGVISAVTIATSIVFPIAFYPYSKSLWVALESKFAPSQGSRQPDPPDTA